ncbi:MAG: hypothetical protein HYY81_00540, partial [Deltaproteobacteria bacterium]|nr:hypothetical protein [Deltaproteobacteria bacterium]
AILPDETDPTERLQFLQEKVLHSALLRKERSELRTLLARLELEEDEEAARIEGAQVKMKENLDSLIGLIREVTTGLNEELKAKNAVSTGKKRS